MPVCDIATKVIKGHQNTKPFQRSHQCVIVNTVSSCFHKLVS